MKKSLYLIAGILIGITLFGGSSVLAAGITAERSTNRIYVDGQEVHILCRPFYVASVPWFSLI